MSTRFVHWSWRSIGSAALLATLAAGGVGLLGGSAGARAFAKRHTVSTSLLVSGTDVIAPQDAPPIGPAPVPDANGTVPFPGTVVLTWRARGLGHGSAVQRLDVTPKAGFDVSGTLRLDAGHGNVLEAIDQANRTDAPGNSQPVQVGRVTETAGTITVLGGTGRFRGASGTLQGTFRATTVSIDTTTSVVHGTFSWALKGKVTLR
jgi:hypothetical protein